MNKVTELRLKLFDNGFTVVACAGKQPVVENWPALVGTLTREMIQSWETKFPQAHNTGVVAKNAPALDIDFTDPEAAATLSLAVQDWFDGSGKTLVRTGNWPRCLVPLRTTEPFPKMLRVFRDGAGKEHKIEVLGDGQQYIVDGTHPDTRKPYTWQGNQSLEVVPYDELPLTSAKNLAELVDYLGGVAREQIGYADGAGEPRTNGGEWHESDFDPDDALANMEPNGASVENVPRRVALSWMQKGVHPNEILERLVARTMEVADAAGLGWSREREVTEVTRRIIDRFKYLMRDHKAELPPWMPGDFHVDVMDRISRGFTPALGRNRYGFYIRKAEFAERKAPNGNGHATNAEELKSGTAPSAANINEGAAERKFQFRLTKWCDMKPGVDPVYLVDELIPVAGLVLLWGKEKTFKSFWLLDLALHVAMGWTYRDRAVQQGR